MSRTSPSRAGAFDRAARRPPPATRLRTEGTLALYSLAAGMIAVGVASLVHETVGPPRNLLAPAALVTVVLAAARCAGPVLGRLIGPGADHASASDSRSQLR